MTNREEQIFLTFERKILRTIFGPVLDQNRWRRRFNHELMELYGEPDIDRFIKINRLRWFVMCREWTIGVYRKIFEDKRSAGRPKARWMDAASANLRTLGVSSLEMLAADRPGWRNMLEKAIGQDPHWVVEPVK